MRSKLLLAICLFVCCVKIASGQAPLSGDPATLGAAPTPNASALAERPNEGFVSSFSTSFSTAATGSGNETASAANLPQSPAAAGANPFERCGEPCAGLGDFQSAVNGECRTWGLQTFVSYDSWRGLSDDSWQNNGINVGANLGTTLGPLSAATGLGFQIGGSFGVYDWSGTEYHNAVETQGFITYGFFRKPLAPCGWTAGVVQDWMLTDNFGEFGQDPTLSQLRAQIGYVTGPTNELGLWGAVRVLGANRDVNGVGATTWRPIDQLNLYWHHKWQLGADTSVWIGIPEQERLGASGSLGEYLAGASATVPLSDRWSLFTLVTYMHPSSRPSMEGSEEEAWNFTIGLSFSWGRDARSDTVLGHAWSPLMPLANNGYFLVDTNNH